MFEKEEAIPTVLTFLWRTQVDRSSLPALGGEWGNRGPSGGRRRGGGTKPARLYFFLLRRIWGAGERISLLL